ncbi:MAG: molybdopterin-dependent oxidoreductase [Chloroflexota bacterium]|nr:molybdopterin-dependent oxidoreductase [Chloroflexota bacterium]
MAPVVSVKPYRVIAGMGAGAGAALAMMMIMGALRFSMNLPTIPELMLNSVIKVLGGQAFSDALDKLYYAGRPLLFTIILEGTLLLGVLLGLLYARLARPNLATGARSAIFNGPFAGIIYGLLIGLLLNALFLPIVDQPPFASEPAGIYASSIIPLWAGLILLALVFGVTLQGLLPKPLPSTAGTSPADPVSIIVSEADTGRRQFLRLTGGTALALVAGLFFWGGGTVMNQGGLESPVDRSNAASADNSADDLPAPDDTPFVSTTTQAQAPGRPSAEVTTPYEKPPVSPTEAPSQSNSTTASTTQPTDSNPTVQAATPPAEAVPTQPATSEAAPTQDIPTQSAPTQVAPTQPAPTQDIPTQPAPTAVIPSNTAQAAAQVPSTELPTSTAQVIAQAPTPTPAPQSTATPMGVTAVAIPVRDIVPVAGFYHVSKNFFDPTVSSDGWTLAIRGLVSNPYSLTYEELKSLPSVTVTVGMMCISNPIGGGLIGNTRWKGVRLADLLKKARPRSGAIKVAMTAADGYTDSITLQKAMQPDVVLAWEMGGAPLTSQHGAPARLLVPGIYGMKHVKWIQSLELVNYDFKGYWQQPEQGWNDAAPVNTMSRVDMPADGTLTTQKQVVSGIAFAGDRSISSVEVSTDGGKSWNQAYVKPPLSSTSWVVWGYAWTPAGPGKYKVVVRATDGLGNLQSARRSDPYPNGATGYHSVTYIVRG